MCLGRRVAAERIDAVSVQWLAATVWKVAVVHAYSDFEGRTYSKNCRRDENVTVRCLDNEANFRRVITLKCQMVETSVVKWSEAHMCELNTFIGTLKHIYTVFTP